MQVPAMIENVKSKEMQLKAKQSCKKTSNNDGNRSANRNGRGGRVYRKAKWNEQLPPLVSLFSPLLVLLRSADPVLFL